MHFRRTLGVLWNVLGFSLLFRFIQRSGDSASDRRHDIPWKASLISPASRERCWNVSHKFSQPHAPRHFHVVLSINIKRCADVVGVASHHRILPYVARRFTRKLQEGRREVGSATKVSWYFFMYNNGINRDSNYETFNLSPFSVGVILWCLEARR